MQIYAIYFFIILFSVPRAKPLFLQKRVYSKKEEKIKIVTMYKISLVMQINMKHFMHLSEQILESVSWHKEA